MKKVILILFWMLWLNMSFAYDFYDSRVSSLCLYGINEVVSAYAQITLNISPHAGSIDNYGYFCIYASGVRLNRNYSSNDTLVIEFEVKRLADYPVVPHFSIGVGKAADAHPYPLLVTRLEEGGNLSKKTNMGLMWYSDREGFHIDAFHLMYMSPGSEWTKWKLLISPYPLDTPSDWIGNWAMGDFDTIYFFNLSDKYLQIRNVRVFEVY